MVQQVSLKDQYSKGTIAFEAITDLKMLSQSLVEAMAAAAKFGYKDKFSCQLVAEHH